MSDVELELSEMEEVSKSLALGIPRDLAFVAAGITRERLTLIAAEARAGTEPHKSWLDGLEQIEARAKVEHLSKLAVSPDWRCRKELLQMSSPDLFSGASAEHAQTYEWMISVIEQETDVETFTRILERLATEEPGTRKAANS